MLVSKSILNELYDDAGYEKVERAKRYVREKRVKIKKVLYDNSDNLELTSKVVGNGETYEVYIQVQNGEIENVTCTCKDYEKTYGACKHIIATIQEFIENEDYVRVFQNEKIKKISQSDLKIASKKENYRTYKQMIDAFYSDEIEDEKELSLIGKIKLEPKIVTDKFSRNLKMEFKIGYDKMYKIKDLTTFLNCMRSEEEFKYGEKLSFSHKREMFEKQSIPILNFILKYADIIQYVNQNTKNAYYGGKPMATGHIIITSSSLDEMFELLENQNIEIKSDYEEEMIHFVKQNPEIQFQLQKVSEEEYKISPNIDVFDYTILKGQEYSYIMIKNILYRCTNEFNKTVLKLLEIFRKNFTSEIIFSKRELPNFFSLVLPKIKKEVNLEKMTQEEIEKYMPKELAVKLFLDFDRDDFITADVRFCYEEIEFNPLLLEEIKVPRDVAKESESLNLFRKTGFLLDNTNKRFVLTNDEKIYQFLSEDIIEYMKKFEVLVTDNFKQKQIKKPKISGIGVRIENNLLDIDLSNLDFDKNELNEIMQKYKLKKKFHRLKNGSFLSLEENEDIEFLDNLVLGTGLDYKDLTQDTIHLPIHRSLYLNRLLENLKQVNIQEDEAYQKIVNQVENKKIEETNLPKSLNADLREYQKIGYKWLKTLDKYQLGGILADDMGLGKTIQLLAIVLSYVENVEKTKKKPSLVICPSSLSLNWYNEAQKFTPKLKVLVIHGQSGQREEQIRNIQNYDLVITSYDLLKRDIELYKQKDYEFQYMIADEAQYIKNSNTKNAKSIKDIKAKTRYALTGTPIENSLSELWSIFDYILPGYLFSYKKFKEKYETPIVKDEDEYALKKLKMLIEPFVLRRIKKEVLTELPDKTESILYNQMGEEQEKIYLSYLTKSRKEALTEIQSNGIEKSQIKILALIMRLRQICCHPQLFIDNYEGESSKLSQCIEIVKDGIHSGHKILLFSGYTSMFDIIQKELEKEKISFFKLTGATKVSERIKLVDEFNQNQDIKVFLISLKAGGTGLNLIGADMVIHYDPWWNLSAENQATDRSYRIGQKNNVQVYKLITKNSIEEKIYELQQRKAKLIDNMLDTNQTFINKLSKEDIMELFS